MLIGSKLKNLHSYSDKLYVKFLILFSFLGILDTFYLAWAKFTSSELYCGVLSGCNKVAMSEYSSVFGIPLAYLGLFFYFFMFFLSNVLYMIIKNENGYLRKMLYKAIFSLTTISSLLSVYFLYIQVFKIKYVCIYCVFSALLSFLMFFVSLLIIFNRFVWSNYL